MRKFNTKLCCVFLALLCLVSNTAFAGASDYWQGKGRIALSSDGNMHDDDDWTACMMTMMILAKARLQPYTVLYTHSDHVWGSEGKDLQMMKDGVEGAAQRWGFNNCTVMAAVEDPEAAYNAMAAQIAKSTEADPLFIIAAGPMQVTGEALNRANATNPDALNYVTVISHSNWNNKHSDNYDKDEESYHTGWTWAEMETAFGKKVNFNYICDQNGTPPDVYSSKDKFAAPSWDRWDWMRTHKDPNIQWVYTRGKEICRPDYSDSGMAYYFCADLDGVRGDDMGNPVKLKNWIGADVIPAEIDDTKVWTLSLNLKEVTIKEVGETKQLVATVGPETAIDKSVTWTSNNTDVVTVDANGLLTAVSKGNAVVTVKTTDGGKTAACNVTVGVPEAGEVTVGEDFIAFEADATTSPLGNWVVRKEGDPEYNQITGELEPIFGTYIEYTAGATNGLGTNAGTDILQYKFTPLVSGAYTLTGRMSQQLNQPDGKAAGDECNDIYIKMEGDFTSGSTASEDILRSWNKFYGRGWNYWGSFVQIDVSHSKYKAIYNLKAGEEYILSISARSRGVCIDYFLLAKCSVKIQEKLDLAVVNPARLRPGGIPVEYVTDTYVASEFEKYTNMGGDFVDAKVDWKFKDALSVADRLKWAAAETPYKGEDANVNIQLTTLLEMDGESTFRVYVADSLVGEVTNPRIFGTTTEEYTEKLYTLTKERIAIKKGDMIRVEFNSATNGMVPEGETTATSRGRWINVKVQTEEIVVPEPPKPVESLLANPSFEDDITAYLGNDPTLKEGGDPNSAIMRADAYDAATNATGNPNMTPATIDFPKGVWAKYSQPWAYVKGLLYENVYGAEGNCMLLVVGQNCGYPAFDSFWNVSIFQKVPVALDATRKVTVTFKAKADDVYYGTSNTCTEVGVMLRDNDSQKELTTVVPLTTPTEWGVYTVEFDLPAAAADGFGGENTVVAFSFKPEYGFGDNAAKLHRCGFTFDDVALAYSSVPTGLADMEIDPIQVIGETGAIRIVADKQLPVAIYNVGGAMVAQTEVNATATVELAKGLYIVKVGEKTYKAVVK